MAFPNFEWKVGGKSHLSRHLGCQPLTGLEGQGFNHWPGDSSITLPDMDWSVERV